jgi:hypothetical protein
VVDVCRALTETNPRGGSMRLLKRSSLFVRSSHACAGWWRKPVRWTAGDTGPAHSRRAGHGRHHRRRRCTDVQAGIRPASRCRSDCWPRCRRPRNSPTCGASRFRTSARRT